MNSDFTQKQKDELIKGRPIGNVINRGGPLGIDTKAPFYGLKNDPDNPKCRMVLCECFGSGTWIRYYKRDIEVA